MVPISSRYFNMPLLDERVDSPQINDCATRIKSLTLPTTESKSAILQELLVEIEAVANDSSFNSLSYKELIDFLSFIAASENLKDYSVVLDLLRVKIFAIP